MLRQKQRTLRNIIHCDGVGLHSGHTVNMTLRPAPVDHGVVFRRVDCAPHVDIPAHYDQISDTSLCTSLSNKGQRVSTVEHFLSALTGVGIDNLLVEINAPELPIMDGSAAPFVFLLNSAGIVEQQAPRKFLVVKSDIEVKDGSKKCTIRPYEGFRLSFTIDFKHACIDKSHQKAHYELGRDSYLGHVARARTFGFLSQVEELRKRNLILGASMRNAVVLDDDSVVNPEGLRGQDEFVKHKILDALGDLRLIGCQILGSFDGVCSGHRMNKQLIEKIMASGDYGLKH